MVAVTSLVDWRGIIVRVTHVLIGRRFLKDDRILSQIFPIW
jgi:hypothetical protein